MRKKNLSGYVFSSYFLIKWLSPSAPLLFLCVGVCLLSSEELDGTTIFAVIISLLLAISLLFLRSKALKNSSTYFICEDGVITNRSRYGNCAIDLRKTFYICQISTPGQAKVSATEHFYMLSRSPLTYIPDWEENRLKAILALSKNGVVIVPNNKDTSTWLSEYLGGISIPKYSKVAYVPRTVDDSKPQKS